MPFIENGTPKYTTLHQEVISQPNAGNICPKAVLFFLQQIFQSCLVPVPETLCFNTSAVMSCRLYLQMLTRKLNCADATHQEAPSTSLFFKSWSSTHMQASYAQKAVMLPLRSGAFFHTDTHQPPTHPQTHYSVFFFLVGIHHLSFLCQIVCSGFCFHSSSEIQSCFILFCSRFSKVVWCLSQKPHF